MRWSKSGKSRCGSTDRLECRLESTIEQPTDENYKGQRQRINLALIGKNWDTYK